MKTPILDALITVMEEVADHNLNLFMFNMYEDVDAIDYDSYEDGKLNIHNCGTSCCIMGYGALSNKVLKTAKVVTRNTDPVETAAKIWTALSSEIGDDFSDSIAGSSTRIRLYRLKRALKASVISDDWVDDYYHVSGVGNNEDPAEAVRYMKKLREVLQSAEN